MGFKKKRINPDEYKALCNSVFDRDNWRCTECNSRNNLTAHHVIYRSQGGEDSMENLKTLCSDCHSYAHGTGMN